MVKRKEQLKLRKLPNVREKSDSLGFDSLSEAELVALLLSTGVKGASVLEIASHACKKIIAHKDGQLSFFELRGELEKIKGIGRARVKSLLALSVLITRQATSKEQILNSPQKIITQCQDMRIAKQEKVICFFLDTSLRMISKWQAFMGTSMRVLISPREVFIRALKCRASKIIVVHNHPSGVCEPSLQDIQQTRKLADASLLLGIPLLDHIILTKESYYSFREKGLLSLD